MNTYRTSLYKTAKIGFLSFLFVCSFGIAVSSAHAQLTDYTTLTPLPGTTESCTGQSCKTNFPKYLSGLFNLSIGIAALLAFVMISWGGFTYMTTDAINGKEEGREKIKEAVYGLLLVIGAYAILYTINPQILAFDLRIQKPDLSNIKDGALIVNTLSGPSLASDEVNRVALQTAGVNIYARACTPGTVQGCVNVDRINPTILAGLTRLVQATCRDTCISIQGGSEGGHTSGGPHGRGSAVDLAPRAELNKLILNNQPLVACKVYPYNGGNFMWEPKDAKCGPVASSGNHWHVTFP